MQKVVVNRCYGGFSLSEKAVVRLAELKGTPVKYIQNPGSMLVRFWLVSVEDTGLQKYKNIKNCRVEITIEEREWQNDFYIQNTISSRIDSEDRADPLLVQVVEELGSEANGEFAELKVIEIPDDVQWDISDYDGYETLHERHRSW
jgi:hypothetical protein